MADEVERLVGNLNDLNSVSYKAGLEFKGLTKRLIKMSDTVSGGGKKWTIFSRIVSGSPIWKIQNKVRALIDSLAMMQEASMKNSEAQEEANKRVIELVQSNEKMKRGVKQLLATEKEMLKLEEKRESILGSSHSARQERNRLFLKMVDVRESSNKEVKEAVINSLAYNKAILQGESNLDAYIKGLKELGIKAEQNKNIFKQAKKDATYQDAFMGDTKTFKERLKGIKKAREDLKEDRKEAFGFDSTMKGFSKFFKGTKGSATEKEQGDIFQRFFKHLDFISKIQRLRLKMAKFSFNMAKMVKPIMNYLFKTLIFVMMGILVFLVLAKILHNAYGFLVEMGIIDQMKEIGSLLMSAISPILGIIGALFEGDLDRLLEKGIELAGILLDIGILTLKVILKTLWGLGVSVFYTIFDGVYRFFEGIIGGENAKFSKAVAKILGVAFAVFLGAFVIKQIAIALLQVAAIYALPVLLGVIIIAAIAKLIAKINPFGGGKARGGVTDGRINLVGEEGPELVHLPKGSRVHSNSDSKKMLGSSGSVVNNFNITVNAKDLSDAELRRVAKQLGNDIFKNINRTSTGRGFV